jgi:hypothetical protein
VRFAFERETKIADMMATIYAKAVEDPVWFEATLGVAQSLPSFPDSVPKDFVTRVLASYEIHEGVANALRKRYDIQ